MLAGITLLASHCSSASRICAKTGNAVNTDSTTAKNGTSASVVVKVSELAVSPRRSC